MTTTKKSSVKVIMERSPYRYVEVGTLEINGKPDCRLLKYDSYTKRYKEIYKFDNEMQMMTAIEDFDYVLWLDNQTCYVKHSDE